MDKDNIIKKIQIGILKDLHNRNLLTKPQLDKAIEITNRGCGINKTNQKPRQKESKP